MDTTASCSLPDAWPEPVVPVQSLSEAGVSAVPPEYIKPPQDRPVLPAPILDVPTVDIAAFLDLDGAAAAAADEQLKNLAEAYSKHGFFQVVNHGVQASTVERMRGAWRRFFALEMEEKEACSNSPAAPEGYGSRAGVEKGALLDWGDYYFLNILPSEIKRRIKWPKSPHDLREITEDYGRDLMNLCEVLLKAISLSLGLGENQLHAAFGSDDCIAACMRVNYYPKCPQPELTLGISSHSDAGGIAVLLADDRVKGTQVRKGDTWYTVQPIPNAFLVNVGDQIQIISNDKYKSVEHRAVASSDDARFTVAFFCNPSGNLPIGPAAQLVSSLSPALYTPIIFDEYRRYSRRRGLQGKSQLEAMKNSKVH
uniref:Fe2OG dioxygenase domain-containing protein n=1 Tax=Oryza glumipatula TaxID=40148 RepID=A0A0E0BIN5_9ORYZ